MLYKTTVEAQGGLTTVLFGLSFSDCKEASNSKCNTTIGQVSNDVIDGGVVLRVVMTLKVSSFYDNTYVYALRL